MSTDTDDIQSVHLEVYNSSSKKYVCASNLGYFTLYKAARGPRRFSRHPQHKTRHIDTLNETKLTRHYPPEHSIACDVAWCSPSVSIRLVERNGPRASWPASTFDTHAPPTAPRRVALARCARSSRVAHDAEDLVGEGLVVEAEVEAVHAREQEGGRVLLVAVG